MKQSMSRLPAQLVPTAFVNLQIRTSQTIRLSHEDRLPYLATRYDACSTVIGSEEYTICLDDCLLTVCVISTSPAPCSCGIQTITKSSPDNRVYVDNRALYHSDKTLTSLYRCDHPGDHRLTSFRLQSQRVCRLVVIMTTGDRKTRLRARQISKVS